MNLTNRTEVTSEIHHSLRTIVVHACEFIEQALLKSSYVPFCLLVQSQRKIVQGYYPGEMEIFADPDRRSFELTSVAKDLATCHETSAVALICGTRPATGPGKRRTEWKRLFESGPENEGIVVNAESREREFSLAIGILRDDSGAFIGLREFPVPPSSLLVRRPRGIEELRRRNLQSYFGLLRRTAPATEELKETHQPEGKRVRRRSARKPSDFEIREFPVTAPSREMECQPSA